MAKITTLFLTLILFFSCSQSKENSFKKEILTWKIQEKQEKIPDKIPEEYILKNCENYSSNPAFYFFIDDICYSLWVDLNSQNTFFLTSSKDFKMVEHYTWERKNFDNLFLKYLEKDKENWYEKYDYKYTQIPKDFTIYPDIVEQYVKIFKSLGIKKLPENHFKIVLEPYQKEDFKKIVKEEKDFIKDGINWKIDYSKLENLDLENLYNKIKKELEKI